MGTPKRSPKEMSTKRCSKSARSLLKTLSASYKNMPQKKPRIQSQISCNFELFYDILNHLSRIYKKSINGILFTGFRAVLKSNSRLANKFQSNRQSFVGSVVCDRDRC